MISNDKESTKSQKRGTQALICSDMYRSVLRSLSPIFVSVIISIIFIFSQTEDDLKL